MKKVLHSLRTSMITEVKRMQEDATYVTPWKFFKDFEFLREEIVKSLNDKDRKITKWKRLWNSTSSFDGVQRQTTKGSHS